MTTLDSESTSRTLRIILTSFGSDCHWLCCLRFRLNEELFDNREDIRINVGITSKKTTQFAQRTNSTICITVEDNYRPCLNGAHSKILTRSLLWDPANAKALIAGAFLMSATRQRCNLDLKLSTTGQKLIRLSRPHGVIPAEFSCFTWFLLTVFLSSQLH
uniref:Signal peptide protein n=1 Tax=Mesocestoides corti TaxID=53468 RepID=A0A5K3G0L7_MESCO